MLKYYKYKYNILNRMSGVVLGSNNITINGRIMETGKSLVEPTTSQASIPITGTNYKYIVMNTINTNSSLVAHYKFDDDFKDSSGNNRHLTAHQNLPVISNTQFKYGNSSYFTSDSLKLQNVVNGSGVLTSGYTFHNKPFSIVLWAYQTATEGNLLSQEKAFAKNQALHIRLNSSFIYTFGFFNNDLVTPVFPNELNNWVHLVFQMNSSRGRQVWRNGVLVASDTASASLNVDNNNIIVSSWRENYSNGYIDALRIYDRPLTQTEILELYNVNDTPKISQVINFPLQTEIKLLLLDNLKYVETAPFLFSGIANINIGDTTSFNTLTTNINSTAYNAGFVSTITGANATYNSPIVIIRYDAINLAQWTYSASNPNVFHLGNVGIGTTNPTSALHVLGSVQVNGAINATSLTANTKNFKIEHPLNINKWLYHGCVESPRFDNIYRGKKKIINGGGEVDIDEECNTTGGMTKGTFISLNTNYSLCLQNKSSYDSVKGIINGAKIIINCENTEEIEVDWLVIGERKDENIKSNELTNNEGKLICEHEMD